MFRIKSAKFLVVTLLLVYGTLIRTNAFVIQHDQPEVTSSSQDDNLPIHRREKRSFDFGGLANYAMGMIYSLTTYPYPYPSLYGQGYGHRLLNPLLNKFGPAGFGGLGGLGGVGHGFNRYNNRYSYSPGSYATFHATRGYGFH